MKNTICLVAMMLLIYSTHAQNKVEETKEKVKNRTENRVDNKIDDAIDSGLNKIEGLFKKKKKKKKDNKKNEDSKLNLPFGKPSNVTIKPVYSFSANMKFQVTTYKKGEESKAAEMSFQYFFPKQASDQFLGMKMSASSGQPNTMQGMMNILDQNNMMMFMDQGGAKFVTVMAIPVSEEVEEDKNFEQSFKKTGNTLEILGYTCEEYMSKTPEFSMKFWVAPTMQAQAKSMTNVFLSMNQSAKVKTAELPHPDMGMVLQMESTDLKTQDKYVMRATELNLNQSFDFSTVGYQKLGMNLGNQRN